MLTTAQCRLLPRKIEAYALRRIDTRTLVADLSLAAARATSALTALTTMRAPKGSAAQIRDGAVHCRILAAAAGDATLAAESILNVRAFNVSVCVYVCARADFHHHQVLASLRIGIVDLQREFRVARLKRALRRVKDFRNWLLQKLPSSTTTTNDDDV